MKPAINHKKIVFFTGAGVSAESGLDTFRGAGGTWDEVDVMAVASTTGWNQNPQQVLDFYNARRQVMLGASPNKAHLASPLHEHRFSDDPKYWCSVRYSADKAKIEALRQFFNIDVPLDQIVVHEDEF